MAWFKKDGRADNAKNFTSNEPAPPPAQHKCACGAEYNTVRERRDCARSHTAKPLAEEDEEKKWW